MELRIREVDQGGDGPSTGSGTGDPSVRSVSLPNWPLSSRSGKISFNISLGARPKGSNGGVAVGLPHRNSSVFKQTPINQWEVKGKIRMDPRIRWGDEGGELITGTRASEAKGPFPGGKRVGSRGKKKQVKE